MRFAESVKKYLTKKKYIIWKKNNLILNKTIYAKRRGVSTAVDGIINLEIETHLRNNPALYFLKLGTVKENDDLSKTYQLVFDLKINQVQKTAPAEKV